MATDAYGAAADHGALSGLTTGDPHTQYTVFLQGTYAARPAQPYRQGARYYATDIHVEFISDGSAWQVTTAASNGIINPTSTTGTSEYLTAFSPADANVLPQSYPNGVSRAYFANGAAGLPTGASWCQVETIRTSTDVTQTLWNITSPGIWRRYAYSAGNAWLPWSQLHTTLGPADSAWIAPTFQNSWVNYGGGVHANAGYRRDADGVVHLRGLVKSGTIASAMFTLPAGYRPSMQLIHPAVSNDTIGRVDVLTTGEVIAYAPSSNVYVSISAVHFLAEQ